MSEYRNKYVVKSSYSEEEDSIFSTRTHVPDLYKWVKSKKSLISNLELFQYYNNIDETTAVTILDYYSNILIEAKLKGLPISNYREKLLKFVSGKLDTDSKRHKLFGEIKPSDDDTRQVTIKTVDDAGGFCKFLVHQYTIDTLVDELYEQNDWNVDDITQKIQSVSSSLAQEEEHSDLSPFTHLETEPDNGLSESRATYVKAKHRFVYKGFTKYFCYSDKGVIQLNVNKSSPFRRLANKALFDGCVVKIGPGKLTTNIGNDTAIYTPLIWEFVGE